MNYKEELETIERLRDSMEQAKALYDGAKAELERAIERYKQLEATRPESLRRATRVWDFTLRNYKQAVMDFNGSILRGELPAHI